jgi:secretion/DNA translocation related TadE-like protein
MSRGGGGPAADRSRPGDEGSASVASVSVVVVTAVLAVAALAGAQALAERSRVAGAADASALAAADVVAGLVAGEGGPCARAASLAGANAVELDSCEVDGTAVTVVVTGSAALLGVVVRAAATAGPPPSVTGSAGPER